MRGAFAAALLLVLVAAGAGLQTSGAATSTKFYTTSIDFSGLAVGTALPTSSVTLTNDLSSTQTLGSEQITIPPGFTVTPSSSTATSSEGGKWNLSILAGNIMQLSAASSGDALDPTQSVTFSITVTASCSAPQGSATWKSAAKQSNSFNGPPGNAFTLKGSDPSSTLSGNCTFGFARIDQQTAGTPFTVSIQALDGNGNPTTAFSGTATLTGATPTGPFGTINGYSPVYGTNGSVTFANGAASPSVTLFKAESGTLTATSGSITGTSNSFTVAPAAPSTLQFDQQPPLETTVDTAFATAPSVNVFDAYGNLETGTGSNQADVTLSIHDDPALQFTGVATKLTAASGNSTTVASVSGVATLPGLSLDQVGLNFTLAASSSGLSGAVSEPFDVIQSGCGTGTTSCETGLAHNTTVREDFTSGTTDPTFLYVNVKSWTSCVGGAGKSALATILPPSGFTSVSSAITVTFTFDKIVAPGTGVANFTLCLNKPGSADPTYGDTYAAVPSCPKRPRLADLPCITKRNRDGVGDLIIVTLMTSTDPIAGLG